MISVHHIGARSGSHPFPLYEKFESEIFYVMYDADPNCIEQIDEKFRNGNATYKVINAGVGKKKENKKLNINYDPNTSSFLKVNQKFLNFYYPTPHGYDYVVDDSYSLVSECDVNLESLDELCDKNNVPFPDLLSMDTQGTELDILKGAQTALSNTVAVVTEVGFVPIYDGQPLFGDIDQYLSNQGFIFCRFYGWQSEMSPYRGALGVRGKGIMASADALYLKSPDFICEMNVADEIKYIMLMKLSYIALAYGMLEYSLQCLIFSQNYSENIPVESEIFKFMSKFYTETLSYKKTPKIFSDVYKVEQSMNRFVTRENGKIKYFKVKKLIKNSVFYTFLTFYRKIKTRMKHLFVTAICTARVRFSKNSSIEKLLIEYGMGNIATEIKKNRILAL